MIWSIFLLFAAAEATLELPPDQNEFAYFVTLGNVSRYLLTHKQKFKPMFCYANDTREHKFIAEIYANMTNISSSDLKSFLNSKFGIVGVFALKDMKKIASKMVSCRKNTWKAIYEKSPKKAAFILLKCRYDITHYYRRYESNMRIFERLENRNHWWVFTTVQGIFDEAVRYSKDIIRRFLDCVNGKNTWGPFKANKPKTKG